MGKFYFAGNLVMPWEAREFEPAAEAEKPSDPKKCIDKKTATP